MSSLPQDSKGRSDEKKSSLLEEAKARLDKAKAEYAALLGNLAFMDKVQKQREALDAAKAAAKEAGDRARLEYRLALVRAGLMLEQDVDEPSIVWSPAFKKAVLKATGMPDWEFREVEDAAHAVAERILAKDKTYLDSVKYREACEAKARELEPRSFIWSDPSKTPLTLLTIADTAVQEAESDYEHERTKALERAQRSEVLKEDPNIAKVAKARKKLEKLVKGEIPFEWPPKTEVA